MQRASVSVHVVPSKIISNPYVNSVTRLVVRVVGVVVVVAEVVTVVENPLGVGVVVTFEGVKKNRKSRKYQVSIFLSRILLQK